MLIESIASEWDTLVEELTEDNRRMRELLAGARAELSPFIEGNESLAALVHSIEEPDGGQGVSPLRVSTLTAENEDLRGKLERLIVFLEDAEPDARLAALMALRAKVYRHLRWVATAGWSFWDAVSFRERMASLKST
jgi:hypothetical protein